MSTQEIDTLLNNVGPKQRIKISDTGFDAEGAIERVFRYGKPLRTVRINLRFGFFLKRLADGWHYFLGPEAKPFIKTGVLISVSVI